MPPLISKLVPTQTSSFISWDVTITDQYNGIKSGKFSVLGDYDLKPYNFSFVVDASSSPMTYQYTINITLPTECVNTVYTLNYVELTDKLGLTSFYEYQNMELPYKSQFLIDNNDINPFLPILADYQNRSIALTCTPFVDDPSPPELKEFSTSVSTLDVGSNQRDFDISFTVADYNNVSSISTRHLPFCYAHGPMLETYKVEAELVSNNPLYTAEFVCHMKIPYGFGIPSTGIYFSIHGYADVNSNIAGFTYFQLTQLTSSSSMPITFSRAIPVIRETSPIKQNSHTITLYGYQFGEDSQIKIEYVGGNSTSSTPTFLSTSVIIFDGITAGQKGYNISVVGSSVQSNVIQFTFPDTQPPVTRAPQSCPGIPECGGPTQGTCDGFGTCRCIKPWVGFDCQSQVVVIDPIIDPNNPGGGIDYNTTLPDGETITIKGIINVISLRELKPDGSLFIELPFNKWYYTNITGNSSDTLRFLYQSNITQNSLTTLVSVTLEFFKVEKEIIFANQPVQMLPSSLKYNIQLSEYSFNSKVNYLQVVMSSSIQASVEDTCTFQESNQNGENSDYFKLQINQNSLYGRFIKRGLVDNKIRSISNSLLNSTEIQSSQTSNFVSQFVGINIPNYSKSAILDPDFSLLIDSRPAKEQQTSVCQSIDDSGLSKTQKIGIIIGCVIFGLIIIISVTYYIYKKRQQTRWTNSINNKISKN